LCLSAVSPSAERDDHACQTLCLNFFDRPPTPAARKLGLDQCQVGKLASRGFYRGIGVVNLGYDAEAIKRAEHGHQRLSHLR